MQRVILQFFAVILAIILSGVEGNLSAAIRVTGAESNLSLSAALDHAEDGDTLIVVGGVYRGPVVIRKTLTLIGKKWPVIDGNGHGTVVEFAAPGIHLQGFVIRNSGISLEKEDAGITVNARGALIRNNRLQGVLFGIYMKRADSSLVLNNFIEGKPALEVARRGDLIRAWYSNAVRVEGNTLQHGRDMIIWFSKNSAVVNNTVTNARYGVHFMYSDDCRIEKNVLTGNSVGVYLMYSRRLVLRQNTIAYNRGPSGFGVGVKDFDDGLLEENLIVDNRVGLFVDNSPRSIDSKMVYTGNVLAYNDVGLSLLSFVKRSLMTGNSFVENYEQVGVTGAGLLSGNEWRENYWSDYAGYDQNGDGIGELPYRSQKLFENLIVRYPHLRLFMYSPVIDALEMAARAFPVVKPQPKLVDHSPRVVPQFPQGPPALHLPARFPLFVAGLLLLVIGLAISLLFGRSAKKLSASEAQTPSPSMQPDSPDRGTNYLNHKGEMMIQAKNVTKTFADITAVDKVRFGVQQGEVLALWGSNGAGKTTLLRCLLGIISFEGQIFINGFEVSRQSKAARRLIGFVPQEISFHDNLTVEETITFYARLKKTPLRDCSERLRQLQLNEHQRKTVKELSGGMKQRLALAIALLADPPILLLDEPTANLDMRSRDEFLQQLGDLKQAGKTMIFSSHRLEEVVNFADRVLVLDQGRVLADAPPKAVYQHLGKRSLLKIYIPEASIGAAQEILRHNGYAVSRNGAGIKVRVEAHAKARPIALLTSEGIAVNNFDYELENDH